MDPVDEIFASAQRVVEDVMQQAMDDAAEELRKDLSVPVGRDAKGRVIVRSKPGEYPRLETGRLRLSVQPVVYRAANSVHGVLATNVPYDQFLIRINRDFKAYTESKWAKRLPQRFQLSLRS